MRVKPFFVFECVVVTVWLASAVAFFAIVLGKV